MLIRGSVTEIRSTPVKNGYMGELEIHQEALEKIRDNLPDEWDDLTTQDLQDLLDMISQDISNYSVAATSMQKIIVSLLNSIQVLSHCPKCLIQNPN